MDKIDSCFDFTFKRADGVYLYGFDGEKVLDFSGSNDANAFGHGNKIIEKTLYDCINKGFFSQLDRFYSTDKKTLSNKLLELGGFLDNENNPNGKCLFFNSINDANECAIKIARYRYTQMSGREYSEVICVENSYFADVCKENTLHLSGIKTAKMNDVRDIEKKITDKTCAVILETVQDRHEVVPCDYMFLNNLRELCTYHKIGLILDETRCGGARTGNFFAFQEYDILPDVVLLGPGITGGFPLTACICGNEFAKYADKFENKNLCCNALLFALANNFVDRLADENLSNTIKTNGIRLLESVRKIQQRYPKIIVKTEGRGLLVGMKIHENTDVNKLAEILLYNGLAVDIEDHDILLLPPLTITAEQIDEACEIIANTLEQMSVIERY
ncbi:MAG: aspartate aminotransferase family protein [Rickettsiales bacterium]|nr:aspartate aminotransferase family protein [Rickettsiales bacterium]